jgi:NIPSNAP
MKTLLAALGFAATILTSSAAETNATPISPSVAKDSRCFEMRTYYAAPGKLEALNARFRDHTCALFRKHGIEIVGFWIPTDKEKGSENTLVYILAHKSREAAGKSFSEFGKDPAWKKAQSESEANGKLVEKIESVFLLATDYSPIK